MFHLFSTVFHYVGIDRCFMDMHRLTTNINDAVCRTVLRKNWYPPTANMNFLRNPSTHFSLFTSNSYDRPPNKKSLSVLCYRGSGQGDITSPVRILLCIVEFQVEH